LFTKLSILTQIPVPYLIDPTFIFPDGVIVRMGVFGLSINVDTESIFVSGAKSADHAKYPWTGV